MDDGTLIIPYTNITFDGITVYLFRDHIIPFYSLKSKLQSKALIETYISYNIILTCENKADQGYPLKIEIPIPREFQYIHSISHEGIYNLETGIWTLTLQNQTATLNLILKSEIPGTCTQTITLKKDSTTLTNTCEIVEKDYETIYYNEEPLKDYPLNINNLQDGKLYTIIKYAYLDRGGIKELDGVYDNRLTVVNDVETIGEHVISERNWEKIITTFLYDKNHPITIREYGQYKPHTAVKELWGGLCINEGYNINYSESSNLLSNPYGFMDDKGSTNLKLPGQTSSASYIYTIPSIILPSEDNPFITGIEVIFNNFYLTSSGIEAQLCNDNGVCSAVKTQPLNLIGQIELGNIADLWKLRKEDIENHSLKIKLKFTNNTLKEQTYTYNNLLLQYYWQDDQTIGLTGFKFNNIHSRIYQIYFDHDNNQNTETNIKTLEFPQTDGIIPVTQNITPRELEIGFKIVGNNLEETEKKYHTINTWLSNQRTENNIPIPNTLIFDYNPTLQYNVILKKLEAEKKISTYDCKAHFLIPDGVGHTTKPQITGSIGMNMGNTPVNPIITVRSKGEDRIILKDEITDYTLTLNHIINPDMVLIFNCQNRTVINTYGDDYTGYITINSTWFKFYQDYEVTSMGALIESVKYHETY